MTEHWAAEIIKISWRLRRIVMEIRVKAAAEGATSCIRSPQPCLKY